MQDMVKELICGGKNKNNLRSILPFILNISASNHITVIHPPIDYMGLYICQSSYTVGKPKVGSYIQLL